MTNGLPSRKNRVVEAENVQMGKEAASIPVGEVRRAPSRAEPEGEPEVQVERAEDGTVRTIKVRCTCGRTVELACEYFQQGGDHEQADS